jgi:hypothetical protein
MTDYADMDLAELRAARDALITRINARELAERAARLMEEKRKYELWAGERDIRYARKLLELPEFAGWPGVAEGREGRDPEVEEAEARGLVRALADLFDDYREEGQEFGL